MAAWQRRNWVWLPYTVCKACYGGWEFTRDVHDDTRCRKCNALFVKPKQPKPDSVLPGQKKPPAKAKVAKTPSKASGKSRAKKEVTPSRAVAKALGLAASSAQQRPPRPNTQAWESGAFSFDIGN